MFLIPLDVLEGNWGNVGGLLGTGDDKFPNFLDLIFEWIGRTRHILGIL